MEDIEYGRERDVGGDAVFKQERGMCEREIENTKRKKKLRRKRRTREGVAYVHGMEISQKGERTDEEARKEERGDDTWKHSGQEKGESDMGMVDGRREEEVSHIVEANVKTHVEGEKVKKKRKEKKDDELELGKERKLEAEVVKDSGRDAKRENTHMETEVKVEVRKKPGREVNVERDRLEPNVKTEVGSEKVKKSRRMERGDEGLEHGKERTVEAGDMKKTGRDVKGENYCNESHVTGEARREMELESDRLEPDVKIQVEGEKVKKRRKERGDQCVMERQVKAEVMEKPGREAEGEDCCLETKVEAKVTKKPGREAKGEECRMEGKVVVEKLGREVTEENGCMDNEVWAGARKKPGREANGVNSRMESMVEVEVRIKLDREARGENVQTENEKEATVEGRRKKVRQTNVFECDTEADEGKEKRKYGCTPQLEFRSKEVEKAKSGKKEKAVSVHGGDLEAEKWQNMCEKVQIVFHPEYDKGEASCGLWGSPAASEKEEKTRKLRLVKRMELDGKKEESPRKERKRREKNRESHKGEVVEEDEPVTVTRLDMSVSQQVEKHGGEDGRMEAMAEEGELECVGGGFLEGKVAESRNAKKGSKKKRVTCELEGDFQQPSSVPLSDDFGEEDMGKNWESSKGEVVKEAEPAMVIGLDMDVVQRVDEHGGQGRGMKAMAKEGEPERVKGGFLKGKVTESGKLKKGGTKKRRKARLLEGDFQQPSPAMLSDDLEQSAWEGGVRPVEETASGVNRAERIAGAFSRMAAVVLCPLAPSVAVASANVHDISNEMVFGSGGAQTPPSEHGRTHGLTDQSLKWALNSALEDSCMEEPQGKERKNRDKKMLTKKQRKIACEIKEERGKLFSTEVTEAGMVENSRSRDDFGVLEGIKKVGLEPCRHNARTWRKEMELNLNEKSDKVSKTREGGLAPGAICSSLEKVIAVDDGEGGDDIRHKNEEGEKGGGPQGKDRPCCDARPEAFAKDDPLGITGSQMLLECPADNGGEGGEGEAMQYSGGLQELGFEEGNGAEDKNLKRRKKRRKKKRVSRMLEGDLQQSAGVAMDEATNVAHEGLDLAKQRTGRDGGGDEVKCVTESSPRAAAALHPLEPTFKAASTKDHGAPDTRAASIARPQMIAYEESRDLGLRVQTDRWEADTAVEALCVEESNHKERKKRKKMEEPDHKEGKERKMEKPNYKEGKKMEELSCKEGNKMEEPTHKEGKSRKKMKEPNLKKGEKMEEPHQNEEKKLEEPSCKEGKKMEEPNNEEGNKRMDLSSQEEGKKRRKKQMGSSGGVMEVEQVNALFEGGEMGGNGGSLNVELQAVGDDVRYHQGFEAGEDGGEHRALPIRPVETLTNASGELTVGGDVDDAMKKRRRRKKRRGVGTFDKNGFDARKETEDSGGVLVGKEMNLELEQLEGAAMVVEEGLEKDKLMVEGRLLEGKGIGRRKEKKRRKERFVSGGILLQPAGVVVDGWTEVDCEGDDLAKQQAEAEIGVKQALQVVGSAAAAVPTLAPFEAALETSQHLSNTMKVDHGHVLSPSSEEQQWVPCEPDGTRSSSSAEEKRVEKGIKKKKKRKKKKRTVAEVEVQGREFLGTEEVEDGNAKSHNMRARDREEAARLGDSREEGIFVMLKPEPGAGMKKKKRNKGLRVVGGQEECDLLWSKDTFGDGDEAEHLEEREVGDAVVPEPMLGAGMEQIAEGQERESDVERKEDHESMWADKDDADAKIQEVAGDFGAEPSSAQSLPSANEMPILAHLPDERRCRRSGGCRVLANGVRTSWRCPRERIGGSVYCASHMPYLRATTPRRKSAPPPDPLPDSQRCTRTCGPKWRCSRARMLGKRRCDVHQQMLDGATKKRVRKSPQVGWNGKWSLGSMPGLGTLGSDITMKILSSVPYEHVMKARLVCKGWRNAVNECDDLWEEMYDSCWGLPPVRPLGRGQRVLTWKAAFLQRLRVQHDTQKKYWECPFCGRAFSPSNRTHILSHTVRLVCEWPECGLIFHQQKALHNHAVQVHGGLFGLPAEEPAALAQNPELSALEGGAQFLDSDEDANNSDWDALSWDSNPRWEQPPSPASEYHFGWEQPPAPPPAQPLSSSDGSSSEDESDSLPRSQPPAQAQAHAQQPSSSDDSSSEDENDSLPRLQPPAHAQHPSSSDHESDQLQRQRPLMHPFAISEEDTSDFDSDA